MDFTFSEEQERIRKLAREFGEKEIAPQVAQYNMEERFPLEIYRKLGQVGILGGTVPPEWGGAGMDTISLTAVCEELGYFCLQLPAVTGLISCMIGDPLLTFGTDAQREKYLKPLCRGETLAGCAVTEPQGGSDVATVTTTATPKSSGYLLKGQKTWISYAGDAGWYLTVARVEGSTKGRGITAFIVERSYPGITVSKIRNKLGDRGGDACNIFFDDCPIPAENVVGDEGTGLRIVLSALEGNRLMFAARCLGGIKACLDESVKYARQRVVYGRPIGENQLIQAKIADMALNLECARWLVYHLAWLKDSGVTRATQESSMAKLFATEAFMKAAADAVQIHGAYGCSDELKVARLFRDAKVHQIMEGTSEIHTILIAQYALGYRTR